MHHDARSRLQDAAIRILARDGIRGVSVRVIATEAGVSQALIFYHYGSLGELLADVAETVSQRRAEVYRDRLAAASSVSTLVDVAHDLHRQEVANGNRDVVRQLVAMAAIDATLRPSLQRSFAQLVGPVEATLRRLLDGTALDDVIDVPRLAASIAGSFLGMQTLDDVVLDLEEHAFTALHDLARIADLLVDAGVLETSVIRRRLRRATSRSHEQP